MSERNITRVVIIGGGTAGWMTAAALKAVFGGRVHIGLVESEEIGTVGVGEATIPPIIRFNSLVGIDEDEFLKATQGTFKLGIEFVDWHRLGHSYMHAFGPIGMPLGMIAFHHYWTRARLRGHTHDLWRYSLNTQAALQSRFSRHPLSDNPMHGLIYAFHFDAGLYAAYLRQLCELRGVKRIEGRISHVLQNPETGFVDAVHLLDEQKIEGDLFIDCSGFRGLLIEQTLKSGYEDWSGFLPCDRAVAVPSENAALHTPYTRATARQAGWQWRIPLQHRTGNGHVFCSRFLTEDQATETLMANLGSKALADPRIIRFQTGRRKTAWVKNVIAMGLASGFMEPLESTSIHMVQSAIQRLITLFPHVTKDKGNIDPTLVEEYNQQTHHEYERIRDFLILHYKANTRKDSEFWQHCASMAIPDSLSHAMEIFKGTGRLAQRPEDLFTEPSWVQVMIGQGIIPQTAHPLADRITETDLQQFLDGVRTLVDSGVKDLPDATAFIAQNCKA
jgi:tryptophan 7-halogenase